MPVGGAAQVIVPAWGPVSSVAITEGGAKVWAAGAFVPGTAGVTAGAASADGKAVVFTVASGTYSFIVYQVKRTVARARAQMRSARNERNERNARAKRAARATFARAFCSSRTGAQCASLTGIHHRLSPPLSVPQ